MSYENNIAKYYIGVFFGTLELTVAIYVLFLLSKGLSMTEVMLLETAFIIMIFLAEVPSGAFADRIGRKHSLVIGSVCASAGFIILGLGESFIVFLLGQVAVAGAWAFNSGADSALMYDTLKELNQEERYAKIFGRAKFIQLGTYALVSLASGYLATALGYEQLFYLTGAIFIVPAIIALTLKEPPKHKHVQEKNYLNHLKKATSFTWKHKGVRNLILYYGTFAALGHLTYFMIQPYYDNSALPTYFVGIAVSLYFASAALGNLTSHVFTSRIKEKRLLLWLVFLAGIAFLLVYFVSPIVAIIFIMAMSFMAGLRDMAVQDLIHRHTSSHHRATVISVQSMSKSTMYAIFAPLLGLFTDMFSPASAFLLMGFGLLLSWVMSVVLFRAEA